MKTFQAWLEKYLVPFSNKLGQNKVLQSISSGMIMTLPVTIGASVFSIFASFPIKSVADWFAKVGITPSMTSIVNGTMNILAMFIAFTIAYSYAQKCEANGTVGGLFSLASFFILMPQTLPGKKPINAFQITYLGSQGIIVAILLSIFIGVLYVKLYRNKKLTIKLPDSVPSMVSSSIEPLIIGIIIFTIVFIIRAIFDYSSFGNVFDFINKLITAPLMHVGGSPITLILIMVLSNVLFTFGIHPAAIQSVIIPIVISMMVSSTPAYQVGKTIPFLSNLVVFAFSNNDAAGATLSLVLIALIFGKSKRYKEFFKVSALPNIFNINEPIIFGMPIVLNPLMFIPFILSSFVSSGVALLAVKIGFITNYNPSLGMGMPWTMPKLIADAMIMGWQGAVVWLINFALMFVIYLPFFRVADKQALEEENSKND
ncbi:PTS system, cellobiose-specific IIC component [Lactobacillus bombicola]|uniref:Permease IIC component n=1 Tax=Lactobacillus bombicola TaxID=1505723 RepID=A0A1I1SJW5_9LACO|nr:PTS transporter subunit EIIC [Lactobacillus bombicola]MCO6527622.1 PTS sugar transporter subunit IIC [Lactobacillus sp.]SFD46769.1 PTS system, cellobiose-specific IIC component [Lactobacillus bombicola]